MARQGGLIGQGGVHGTSRAPAAFGTGAVLRRPPVPRQPRMSSPLRPITQSYGSGYKTY